MSTSLHRIFVSHSHKDNEFGLRLTQDLKRVFPGLDAVWYDAGGGLHGGTAWRRTIVREITLRSVFLVILSALAKLGKKQEAQKSYAQAAQLGYQPS